MLKYFRQMCNFVREAYVLLRTHNQRTQEMQQLGQNLDQALSRLELKVTQGNTDLALAGVNLNLAYSATQSGDRELFERCAGRIEQLSRPYLRQ